MNDIYLDYIQYGWTQLSTMQKQSVESMAKSCLYLNGNAVYTARIIWSSAEPALCYNDLDICTYSAKGGGSLFEDIREYLNGETNASITPNVLDNISVYPNPSNGEINIEHHLNDGILLFELYDDIGRKIKSIRSEIFSGTTPIYLQGLTAGMYAFKLYHHGELIMSDKLTITP